MQQPHVAESSLPSPAAGSANRRIVLAGNPNSGKSVVFHALSGVYAEVSNYPGTTIEITQTRLGHDLLLDSPGIYGLGSFNDEELVARDIILGADIIINVVDAVHLQRDLFLTLQLLELKKPMVVALNMMDEAAGQGVSIDIEQLARRLGVPVLPTVAVKKQGLAELKQAIQSPAIGNFDTSLAPKLEELASRTGSRGHALLLLEGDAQLAKRHPDLSVTPIREEIYQQRRLTVDALVDDCVGRFHYHRRFRDKLSWVTLHPALGAVILAAVLWCMYQVLGVFIAGTVVGVTEEDIMQARYEPAVQTLVARIIPPESFTFHAMPDLAGAIEELAESDDQTESAAGQAVLRLWEEHFEDQPWHTRAYLPIDVVSSLDDASRATLTELTLLEDIADRDRYYITANFSSANISGKAAQVLAGPYGVLTHTARYLIGLLLPLVLGFYLMLALLEDCGYLPRLATLADRTLNTIGLNGRAVIPIILGFGCVTMATITTRLLGTEREKSIASSILNFVIPCSAQLGVIVGILAIATLAAGGNVGPIILYCSVILVILIVLGTMLDKLLPGKSSQLFIELPPLRVPRLANVLKKSSTRTFAFVREAFPWFVFGSMAVALLEVTGVLLVLREWLAPMTENWLRLTRDSADAFIMGLVRRDFGAAGLTRLARSGELNAWQMTISLIVITLFVPCIASLLVLMKERGWKQAAAIWIGTWITAFTAGGLVAQGLRMAGLIS